MVGASNRFECMADPFDLWTVWDITGDAPAEFGACVFIGLTKGEGATSCHALNGALSLAVLPGSPAAVDGAGLSSTTAAAGHVAAVAGLRAGIVIAATPTMMQTRPIPAVPLNVSPRKTAPMPTPIGTRK
jgi:hypothetical protein